jgi:DNA polymerase V
LITIKPIFCQQQHTVSDKKGFYVLIASIMAVVPGGSFGIPVTSIESLMESVTLYTSRAAEKARAQHIHANSISVFIQTSPFAKLPYYGGNLTVALPSPSNDTRLLVKTALWIVKRIYKSGYVY